MRLTRHPAITIWLTLLMMLALAPARVRGQGKPTPAVPLVVRHVSVIDGSGTPPSPDMIVVVTGRRITALGREGTVHPPRRATTVDGRGKFLIPGLRDMHVHLSITTESSLGAFIANGVTGVRDMGGDLDQIDGWRREIAIGARIGPRIVRCGPLVDGPKKTAMYRLTVTNAAEAQRAVDSLRQRGVDFIKVHNRVPREAYFALADECRKTGMRYAGHIPRGVSVEEASAAGQRSIEHTETLVEAAAYQPGSQAKSPEEALDTYTPERRAALFAEFVRNGTWYCPTLLEYHHFAFETDSSVLDDPRNRYLARAAREYIEKFNPAPDRTVPVEQYAGRRAIFRRLMGLVAEMQRAGVGLLAGTDPPARGMVPGFSLHDELATLVEAGLTPMQALQTATRNPAVFLGELDSLGTVDKDKVADLILLEGNPLDDIRNTRRIAAVIVGGTLIRKPELRSMLERVEESVKGEFR